MRTLVIALAFELASIGAYAQGKTNAHRTSVEKCFDLKTDSLTIESCADIEAKPTGRQRRAPGAN
jgi:hypothetical protein